MPISLAHFIDKKMQILLHYSSVVVHLVLHSKYLSSVQLQNKRIKIPPRLRSIPLYHSRITGESPICCLHARIAVSLENLEQICLRLILRDCLVISEIEMRSIRTSLVDRASLLTPCCLRCPSRVEKMAVPCMRQERLIELFLPSTGLP